MALFNEMLRQWRHNAAVWLSRNCASIGSVLFILLPFAAFIVGSCCNVFSDGVLWFWVCLVIILAIVVLAAVLRGLGARLSMANDLPVPLERFTDVSNDGEVTVPYERIQELLLYTADLEDYFERYGYFDAKGGDDNVV